MVYTAWDQSHWWRAKDDYGFGWLVPLFVAYVVYDRWPRIAARLRSAKDRPAETDPRTARWTRWFSFGVASALVVGGALFLVGALYRAAAGPSYSGTLAITLGMAATVLPAIYLLAPALSSSDRRGVAGLFLFPALVWLVSAPMITAVENNLNVFLMRQVTSAVFFVFDALGLALEQQGNVLLLPTGSVGVAEACSGIRSLTGCLFAGSFLAAVYLEAWWRKAVLMAAAVVFAVGANLLRSLFLTSWAYRHGAQSIEGAIHDLSGYAVLGLTVVALFGLLPILSPRKSRSVALRSE